MKIYKNNNIQQLLQQVGSPVHANREQSGDVQRQEEVGGMA